MVDARSPLSALSIRAVHGGTVRNRHIIDFSTNINPYGPPEFVMNALSSGVKDVGRYPDSECTELTNLISIQQGVNKNELLVSDGITDLIRLVGLAFIDKDKRVHIPEFTYCEYERISRLMGAAIRKLPMRSLRLPSNIARLRKNDVVWLCNPNNPTGEYLKKPTISSIVDQIVDRDALLVIDEAYVDFVCERYIIEGSNNVIVLRSLTKSYSIPGIKIGYALSSENNIKLIKKVQAPWSVNAFAQNAGLAILRDNTGFIESSRARLFKSKALFEKELGVASDTNFYLYSAVGKASKICSALLRTGLCVRNCASFGLPAHIRFSVRKDRENKLLIAALNITLADHDKPPLM